jgi:hypothetical protein
LDILAAGSGYLAPFILSSSFGFSIVHCYTGMPLIFFFPYPTDEKVTVLETEKRAWKSSPEAQAMREALNPWCKHDEQHKK